MEAVTGQTAGCVAFVGGLGAASTLMCVPGLSVLVLADKDNIVVLGGLINQTAIGKRVQHLLNLMIQKTKGHGLAKIVDAILRAKGFTTYVSPAGPDKGVDILASAGTLGFGSPKICVQVKSSDAPVDRIVLDQLGGVMKNFGAEYGLLVSWSGFKSSVINETAKQFFEIQLWTHKEIIQEFLRYYDQMDAEIKELIPLKKIWVVNTDDE